MARLKDTLTLSVPGGTKEMLDGLAERLNLMWGDRPSPSKLVAAIASGELTVGPRTGFVPEQVTALEAGIDALLYRGKHEEARVLITTLLSTAEVPPASQRFLMEKLESLSMPWLDSIERHRRERKPFRLVYQSGRSDETRIFTVRYAEVCYHDGVCYVEAHVDESDGSTDLDELKHNRSLRLDRVKKVVELPGDTRWYDRLNTAEVTIKMNSDMLKFYKMDHPEADVMQADDGKAVLVKREIRFGWWFVREMLERGPGFEIVAPMPLRQRMRESLEQLLAVHQ